MIFHEKSSAKSENVMVSPKNFTVGSPVTSDQAWLQIVCLGNVFKTARLYQSVSKAKNLEPDQRLLSTQQRTIFSNKKYFQYDKLHFHIILKSSKNIGVKLVWKFGFWKMKKNLKSKSRSYLCKIMRWHCSRLFFM